MVNLHFEANSVFVAPNTKCADPLILDTVHIKWLEHVGHDSLRFTSCSAADIEWSTAHLHLAYLIGVRTLNISGLWRQRLFNRWYLVGRGLRRGLAANLIFSTLPQARCAELREWHTFSGIDVLVIARYHSCLLLCGATCLDNVSRRFGRGWLLLYRVSLVQLDDRGRCRARVVGVCCQESPRVLDDLWKLLRLTHRLLQIWLVRVAFAHIQ